ncbi:hypothetical protein TGAMA5MH_03783 [Trichoderma gamsii]|uniref:Uncharacterized protein n=1 Tax=Trichoderma gamsii TaxID=398673 RepID=A0A2K0TG32_9HYPO|nr:hypothetical protein TGAMA5MH_03783 [Trichoderma gamsii]
MAKRKSTLQSTVAYKKPRLDDPDTILPITHYANAAPSLISLPMASESFKKRRRADTETELEPLEEPRAKRIKTSDSQGVQTRGSRNSSPGSNWSILPYVPEEEDEGPNPEIEAFRKAYQEAVEENSPALLPTLLPSPEPSDRDETESNGTESDEAESDELRFLINSTPEPSTFPHQHPRRRDTMLPNKKRRQPPKKGKDGNERNERRNNALQHAVEAILYSKRSSRRDHNCVLWQLGDDGTAREVSKAR